MTTKRAWRATIVAVAAALVSGCAGPAGSPGGASELEAFLLKATDVPPGWRVARIDEIPPVGVDPPTRVPSNPYAMRHYTPNHTVENLAHVFVHGGRTEAFLYSQAHRFVSEQAASDWSAVWVGRCMEGDAGRHGAIVYDLALLVGGSQAPTSIPEFTADDERRALDAIGDRTGGRRVCP